MSAPVTLLTTDAYCDTGGTLFANAQINFAVKDQILREDLEHAAYQTPVDTLVNMWLTKYGNSWVEDSNVDDDFFLHARLRLTALGRIETHQLVGNGRVHRMPA